MNKFEKMITEIYANENATELVREARQIADDFAGVADPQEVYRHEISVTAMYRVTYLAVHEYHKALSRHLQEHGITLPDLEELF